MLIQAEWLITAGSLLGLFGSCVAVMVKIHKWYLKQEEQTRQIERLQHKHTTDVGRLNQENQLIIVALSACLDGLMQLGANHSVPHAKRQLDDHLNRQAHNLE